MKQAVALTLLAFGHYQAFAAEISRQTTQVCLDCHDQDIAEGGLNLSSLTFNFADRLVRERWMLSRTQGMLSDADDQSNRNSGGRDSEARTCRLILSFRRFAG